MDVAVILSCKKRATSGEAHASASRSGASPCPWMCPVKRRRVVVIDLEDERSLVQREGRSDEACEVVVESSRPCSDRPVGVKRQRRRQQATAIPAQPALSHQSEAPTVVPHRSVSVSPQDQGDHKDHAAPIFFYSWNLLFDWSYNPEHFTRNDDTYMVMASKLHEKDILAMPEDVRREMYAKKVTQERLNWLTRQNGSSEILERHKFQRRSVLVRKQVLSILRRQENRDIGAIMCFQEVTRAWKNELEAIRKEMNLSDGADYQLDVVYSLDRNFLAPAVDDHGKFGVAVMIPLKTYRVLRKYEFNSWFDYRHGLLMHVLEDRRNHRRFVVANFHMPAPSKIRPKVQTTVAAWASNMIRWAARTNSVNGYPLPIIWGGDLNTKYATEPWHEDWEVFKYFLNPKQHGVQGELLDIPKGTRHGGEPYLLDYFEDRTLTSATGNLGYTTITEGFKGQIDHIFCSVEFEPLRPLMDPVSSARSLGVEEDPCDGNAVAGKGLPALEDVKIGSGAGASDHMMIGWAFQWRDSFAVSGRQGFGAQAQETDVTPQGLGQWQ